MKNKIWSFGIAMLDIVSQPITKWPEYGGSVFSDTTDFVLGGMALNTAVSMAKIGHVPVGLISCVGHDLGGQILETGLKRLKIDTEYLCYADSDNTGVAICFIHPDGERSMVLCIAANNQLNETKVNFKAFHDGDFLHIGGSMVSEGTRGENLAKILKKVKEKDVKISLDTCWDGTNQWGKILTPSLPYCDIFFTNDDEARLYSGKESIEEALDYFSSFGPKILIVKMGSKGALVRSQEFCGLIPIFEVKTADATGAGDSFDAGFLFGLYNHWSIEQSAIFASAVGAKCVTAFGATTGVTCYEETLQMIRTQSRDGNWNWVL
jgi:sugar/nucleoside kinase (ribokinase family)